MSSRNIFDDFANVGREFRRTSRGHVAVQEYNWQLEQICRLLRHTHSKVVDKLEAIEALVTPAAANELASQLRAEPLTESFRVAGLCDVFEGYGRSLSRVLDK